MKLFEQKRNNSLDKFPDSYDNEYEGSNYEEEDLDSDLNFQKKVDFKMGFFNCKNLFEIILGFIFSVLNGISIPLFLLYFGLALQKIPQNIEYPEEEYKEFIYYIYCLIGVTLNSFFSGWLSIAIFEGLSESYVKRVKRECFLYLLCMDESWYNQNDNGSISSKIIANCALIREGYGIKLSQLISNVSQFIFGFIIGFYRGWKMSLIMSASFPVVGAAGFLITKIHKSWGKNTQEVYSKSGTLAFETFKNIKVIKAYCLELFMFKKYYEFISEAEKSGLKASLFISFGMGVVSFVVFASYSLGFWYGGALVADSMDSGCNLLYDLNCFTVANVISIFFVITNASIALGQSTPSLGSLVKGSLAYKELSVLFQRPLIRNQEYAIKPKSIKGKIEFKKVSFSYPSTDSMILKDFDLSIEQGKTTAIIGTSGCGKSSILKLILRLYDPNKGKILLDGFDLKKYDLNYLREKITMVDQESRLFNGTIRQNILYGNLKANENEINEALKISQALDFVNSLPNKLETQVGNEGNFLSGGQRQRIAIARALIRNSEIIILDEATSGLDIHTETLFTESFTQYVSRRKITVIIIAHRLQTIKFSDNIVILDNQVSNGNGLRVIEQGPSSQLIKLENGVYSCLLKKLFNEKGNLSQDFNNSRLSSQSNKTLRKLTTLYSKNTNSSINPSMPSSFESFDLFLSKAETKDYTLMVKDIFNDNIKAFSFKLPKVSSFKLFLLMKKDIHYLILGILSASVQGATFPLMGYLIGKFVTSAILPTSDLVRSQTSTYSLYFLFLAILIFITTFAQNSFLQIFGERLIKRLRAECFYSLLYQDIPFYENSNNNILKLCNILAEDTRLAKSLVGENIGLYTQNIVTVLLGFVVSFSSSVELTLVILGFFILLIPTGYAQSKIIKGSTNRDIDKSVNSSSRIQSITYVQEVLQMHAIIKIFNLQQLFASNYRRSTRYEYFKGVVDSHLLGLCWGFGQAIQNTAQTFGLWYGSNMTIRQKINLGELVQTILSLILTAASVCRSQIYGTDKKKAKISANNVFSIINRIPITKNKSFININERYFGNFSFSKNLNLENSSRTKNLINRFLKLKSFFKIKNFINVSPKNLEALTKDNPLKSEFEKRNRRGDISFSNVDFSYINDKESLILSNLSFNINSGEFVAIIGESGCGKSTIFELLEKFYLIENSIYKKTKNSTFEDFNLEYDNVQINLKNENNRPKSKILVDNINIDELDVGELRKYFSYMQQNPILFSGTIEENIKLGNLESNIEDIIEVSKISQAFDFIQNLPDGFKTKVSLN